MTNLVPGRSLPVGPLKSVRLAGGSQERLFAAVIHLTAIEHSVLPHSRFQLYAQTCRTRPSGGYNIDYQLIIRQAPNCTEMITCYHAQARGAPRCGLRCAAQASVEMNSIGEKPSSDCEISGRALVCIEKGSNYSMNGMVSD
jgi:hypothetical protein